MNSELLKIKYKELRTIDKVAKYFNVSRSTIKNNFKKYNITYENCIKLKFNENFFNNSPESFYIAGFIAADGSINKNNLSIQLSSKDSAHLYKIKELLQLEGELQLIPPRKSEINKRIINGGETILLRCNSSIMINDLKRFNIVPNKSKIYDMPDWLINHSLVNHFMRGYFDGDGSIGFVKTKLRWSLVGNVWFLEKYQNILEKNCNISHNKICIRKEGLGQLEYQGNIVIPKICRFLYNDATCYLERKFNIYKSL